MLAPDTLRPHITAMAISDNLEKLLQSGQDNALLRFGLGNAYLQEKDPEKAVEHLRIALQHNPDYSAAWKIYGKALAAAGRTKEAVAAYDEGIRRAEKKGDIQAAKEMNVFRKRLIGT